MVIIWKQRRGKPPCFHLSHHTLHFSEQQLPKHSALARVCSLQLPETNQCPAVGHRRHLPSLYERPESWASGQIPTTCQLFLRSTPRAGLRQNSGKTSHVPILPEHLHCMLCTASSKAAAFCLGTSTPAASEAFSSSSNPLVWERWVNTAMPVPLLTWLSTPWANKAIKPQRMSPQALENQYQQLPVTNEHLPTSQSVTFDSLWEQRD